MRRRRIKWCSLLFTALRLRCELRQQVLVMKVLLTCTVTPPKKKTCAPYKMDDGSGYQSSAVPGTRRVHIPGAARNSFDMPAHTLMATSTHILHHTYKSTHTPTNSNGKNAKFSNSSIFFLSFLSYNNKCFGTNHRAACRDVISPFIGGLLTFSEFQLSNSASHSVLCELCKWARMVCYWLDVSVSDWRLISPPAIPFHRCTESCWEAVGKLSGWWDSHFKKQKTIWACLLPLQCTWGSRRIGFWTSLNFNSILTIFIQCFFLLSP